MTTNIESKPVRKVVTRKVYVYKDKVGYIGGYKIGAQVFWLDGSMVHQDRYGARKYARAWLAKWAKLDRQ